MARLIVAILALFLLMALPAWAMTVKLAWDPYPNVKLIKGFELFYRPSAAASYDLDKPILKDIPATATECTVEVPEDGFFVLRAYTSSGKKSGLSKEVPTKEGVPAVKNKIERPKIPPRRQVDFNAGEKIPPSRRIEVKGQGSEAGR